METQKNQQSSGSEGQTPSAGAGGAESVWISLGRAFAGALIFAIPFFMTMEMWWLGFYMNRFRLVLFLLANLALLIGLAQVRGFKQNLSWVGSTIDALAGYCVGFLVGALFLSLFGIINFAMSWDEIIGKIVLQSVPASIGALLARSQLGGGGGQQQEKQEQNKQPNYARELFVMVVGALYVGFSEAPSQEMEVITYKITPWIALGLIAISIIIMHAIVYAVNFTGQEQIPEEAGFWSAFLRFSVAGYAAVLLTSYYILWTFGRLEGAGLYPAVMTTVVLSVPGALGAAAARLIV